MFSKNKIFLTIIILNLASQITTNAQIHFGVSLVNNYDTGSKISNTNKWINSPEFTLLYNNNLKYCPYISIIFSKIQLNFNDLILKNQGNSRIIAINNSTNLNIGLQHKVYDFKKIKFHGKLGLGLSFLSNPQIYRENSNSSFGANTNYTSENSNRIFSFIDLATKLETNLTDYWRLNLQIGSLIYPTDNSTSITTNMNNKEITIDSNFTKIRPYFKFGILYEL